MMEKLKVLEKNKENPYLSNIEKSGVKVEFSIVSLWDNIKHARKTIIELESQLGIEKATKQNVERTHGTIVDIASGKKSLGEAISELGEAYKFPADAVTALYLWRHSTGQITLLEDKIAEYEVAIRDDNRTLEEACKLLGVITPEQMELIQSKKTIKDEIVDKVINAPVAEEEKKDDGQN